MPDHMCLSNHDPDGEVTMGSILAKVLVNASPFQLITHQQVLDSEGLWTMDNCLGVLEVVITDNDGHEFTAIGEHEIVLSIESQELEDYDTKRIVEELKEMRRTLKDLLLYKVLKPPR